MKYDICVLGAGSWGTALAISLAKGGHRVRLWMRNSQQYEEMMNIRENIRYLPGTILPVQIELFNDIQKAVKGTDIILLAVSSQAVRSVVQMIKDQILPEQIIVNAAKGLENDTLLRISEIINEELPGNPFVTLSGPSHAEEVCKDMPTTLVVASSQRDIAEKVQDVLITPRLRVYTNPDVVGVELGGSLKNVIALGAGISDGLGYGDNAKAAIMTRGIREISRLGHAMGADMNTFSGLSGIGDLIVTCTSMHSRNRRCGIQIGKGKSLDEALESIGMVVEGVTTTKAAYELSKKFGVEMPITAEIYRVLYEGSDVRRSVCNLMMRNRKHEMEEVVNNKNFDW